ncbi:putative Bifunctional aspartokinase/homoserine dehydrogenase 2, chloroplastic [Nannochloris sp. 'desiccata']|nr:putative Bifunctional aspartokinase/homoserine dehydrogenase 2, chloroplastic [Chlorella desiccata (nom. nud.)]
MLGQHPLVTKQSHVPKCSRLSFKNQSTVLGQPLAAGISCQPSQRKTSSSGRAIIRTVRATIAEPSSKDAVNTWSRGGHWQVHKFGGTCVANAERIENIAKYLMADSCGSKVVVVSAMGSSPSSPVKVTDLLINMVNKAARQDEGFLLDLAALQEKHVDTARLLLGDSKDLNDFVAKLLDDISNLKAMLHAISIAGMSTDAFEEFVVGHGELWCAQLTAAKCRQMGANAKFMDTRDVLVVTPTSDGNSVDVQYDMSNKKLDMWTSLHGVPNIIIATGFIAKNPAGQATTLKRNGSDYSATIIGALFQAGHISIWTDVDGVYSADPRKVSEAICLRHLSYHEAWELSYFGANVLHPRTTLPAMKYGIPITIRNFFNLSAAGTVISDGQSVPIGADTVGVKGFATIENVSLINVEGTGMVGVPGTAATIFSTIRDANINAIMISQASSEHSVCFAVKGNDSERAVASLRKRFSDAISSGRISAVEAIDDCCILAVVGQQMASRRGVAATLFDALAKANINVRAIAQGSSEFNITALIDQKDAERALRAVHGRFYRNALPIGVGLVGPGLIGATFLQQIQDQLDKLQNEYKLDIRVLGLVSSKKMLLSDEPLDLSTWQEDFASKGEPVDLDRFAAHLSANHVPNTVIVDCTAAEEPPAKYLDWMRRGIHVITPNKKLNSGSLARYQELKQHQRTSYIHYFYEGTVGAGLPVLGTLQHLVGTGDKVEKIEGIFSGTLSYIFNTFGSDTRSFSEVVGEARAAGYTEPDPRDDLAGVDVARKVTILAREAGMSIELEDVPIESLVPEPLQGCATAEEYMSRLPEFDGDMGKMLAEADAAGECLRYVGVVDMVNKKGSVELRRYPKDHAFAQLTGSDNIIAFTTGRYKAQPLIIRGPGAGAEVTAGGVFSDLLRLAAYLGAAS